LRALEERSFTRLGGKTPIEVDVRLVAATNRDLKRRVEEGFFREDLFYRLNVFSLELPPLRSRPEDISILAQHFLDRQTREEGRRVRGFRPEALHNIQSRPWPGNVRELKNAVERALILCRGEWIERDHLPPDQSEKLQARPAADGIFLPHGLSLRD